MSDYESNSKMIVSKAIMTIYPSIFYRVCVCLWPRASHSTEAEGHQVSLFTMWFSETEVRSSALVSSILTLSHLASLMRALFSEGRKYSDLLPCGTLQWGENAWFGFLEKLHHLWTFIPQRGQRSILGLPTDIMKNGTAFECYYRHILPYTSNPPHDLY